MESRIIHGDCLEIMKNIPDGSIDAVITDPPYGYSFMGKDWDKAVPSVEIWKECLRVLKPGAFAFIMSAPRSDVLSRMIVRVEDAGFRVDFTPIYWTYASGFPKAINIGKMVDKRLGAEREREPSKISKAFRATEGREDYQDTRPNGTPITPEAKALDGSYGGFQPKPAVEVIIVAMKPLSEKTFVDQALKNGKGVTWLDDCRVPTEAGANFGKAVSDYGDKVGAWDGKYKKQVRSVPPDAGRFPANLLVSDDVLNDGRDRPPAGNTKHVNNGEAIFGNANGTNLRNLYGTVDSYSRYFDLDKWWAKTFPFLIVPKASKSEKNKGLEDMEAKPSYMVQNGGKTSGLNGKRYERTTVNQNSHPTVKPLKLMSYLITLGSRPGDTIIDPFMGSGTTIVAAKQLGRNATGIEISEEYCDIARNRLAETQVPML